LDIFWKHVESRRISGNLPEGDYRQKGNAFRDFISELIYIRSDGQYRLVDIRIPGYTEKNHDVDLAYLHVAVGEVKMTGSPAHRRGNALQKERKTQSDLDKRLKEVKFTAVDLELYYTPTNVAKDVILSVQDEEKLPNPWWEEWIKLSVPGFYSFWASRLASGRIKYGKVVNADNPSLLLEKFQNLSRYNNAVGLFMFKEDGRRYIPVMEDEIKKSSLSVDDAIQNLLNFLDKHVG